MTRLDSRPAAQCATLLREGRTFCRSPRGHAGGCEPSTRTTAEVQSTAAVRPLREVLDEHLAAQRAARG